MSSEEDYMKTRLLIDGEGTGEDRRLNTLYKNILKWISEEESDDSSLYQRILTQISYSEWSMKKSLLVESMNQEELSNYQSLVSAIEEGVSESKKEISDSKDDLEEAGIIRQHKLEYDALAKAICKYPSREAVLSGISGLQSELAHLRRIEASLDGKFDIRKKQFHVLLHSIGQLHELLDDSSEDGHQDDLMEGLLPPDLNTSNVSSTPEQEVEDFS
uniref:THO complex subunit 7 homolog n=1 Tax=Caligus rogercresseyi TaxID=217165 RepID=C1BQL1_CALRO|nr:THO complex subunit 7 homolog [Caligus rogercresseyi]|eukprot:TRINITY_DN12412_c0_g1_i1.p1 TRINITY_DN12412_c0_g1~~TRINITY_DN12412_c0_g1_i1.p1  ORF type:complete len:217 (-),score=95.50 TRINITY_DN12412_c0_g1_i1:237-887(-)